MNNRIEFAKGHFLAPVVVDAPAFDECGDRCDCEGCDAEYRQGRSLASVESSSIGFLLAALGIVAMLVAALVMA